MFAKIIAWDFDREKAIAKLNRALCETIILGIRTNIDYLKRITAHPIFQSGAHETRFIADFSQDLVPSIGKGHLASAIAATLNYINQHKEAYADLKAKSAQYINIALNVIPEGAIEYIVKLNDTNYSCVVAEWDDSRFFVTSGDSCTVLDITQIDPYIYSVKNSDNKMHEALAFFQSDSIQMVLDGEQYAFEVLRKGSKKEIKDPHATPYGGRIVRLCVKTGQPVVAGDDLYVIESMKMETVIRASFNGFVEKTCYSAGHSVEAGDIVMRIAPFEKIEDEKEKIAYISSPNDQDALLPSIFLPKQMDPQTSGDEDELYNRHGQLLTELPLLYFIGYDIPASVAMAAFEPSLLRKRPAMLYP